MIEVRQTDVFKAWFAGLRDRKARARIAIRIQRLERGNPGDGPGYRMYFAGRGKTVVILLCGGDKRSQARDIARAIEMAQKV
jgi:putative component of toxin-antitoxin plasmid stabilization module